MGFFSGNLLNVYWFPLFLTVFYYCLSNFNAFFSEMIFFVGYWLTIKIFLLFNFEKGSKNGQNADLCIYGSLDCIFKSWNSKNKTNVQNRVGPENYCFQIITVSNTLLCPAIYCVKQNTVSTLIFNIHLIKLFFVDMLWSYHASLCVAHYLLTCCSHIMLLSA